MTTTGAFGETTGSTTTAPLTINVWSDIMCPFCYIGDTELAKAIEQFEHKDQVTVRYHSYQLMPELTEQPVDLSDLFSEKRGVSSEQMQAMNAQIAERGASLGIEYRLEESVTVNTRRAHRVAHFAETEGKGHEMMLRLFKAYFTDGLNVADAETLAKLAVDVGLDYDRALEVAQSEEFEAEVAADIAQAGTLQITGVPFFVIDNAYAVSGAQPAEAFTQALETAWSARK